MLGCARYSIEIRLEISLAIGLSQVPHFPRLAKCLGMQLSRFDDEYAIATWTGTMLRSKSWSTTPWGIRNGKKIRKEESKMSCDSEGNNPARTTWGFNTSRCSENKLFSQIHAATNKRGTGKTVWHDWGKAQKRKHDKLRKIPTRCGYYNKHN